MSCIYNKLLRWRPLPMFIAALEKKCRRMCVECGHVLCSSFGPRTTFARSYNHNILQISRLATFLLQKSKLFSKGRRFEDVEEIPENATRLLLAIPGKNGVPGMLPSTETTLDFRHESYSSVTANMPNTN